MNILRTLLLLLLLPPALAARVLEVGAGGPYTNLAGAAADASPGDTILFRGGTYPGGEYVNALQGRADAWITIMADPGAEVILLGGSNAWQLADPAYLHIIGFTLEGQTGNGLNIDDGGSFETPAHHLIIERCTWRGIAATGNNDLLKLSGLDSFEVRDCTFSDGSPGGSMIDMVGCHNGTFTGNLFQRAGSNCIQAKGGTRYIRIERNTFLDGGARALNIGGSTGLEFFRPQGASYESADIGVYSNIFAGSDAPIAFVGTVNSEVVNNTIYLPGRWSIRILQETTGPNFLECGDNTFRNNIVVVGNAAAAPTINIGPNTRPESFTFSNNLWYNIENPNWGGPNLPAPESDGIIGRDPRLTSPPTDMRPSGTSPAVGAGYPVMKPSHDYLGKAFSPRRSIGAIEGSGVTTSAPDEPANGTEVRLVLDAGENALLALMDRPAAGTVAMELYDMRGKQVPGTPRIDAVGATMLRMPLGDIPSGAYICVVRHGRGHVARAIVVQR